MTDLTNQLQIKFKNQTSWQFDAMYDMTWAEDISGLRWFFSGAPGIFYTQSSAVLATNVTLTQLTGWEASHSHYLYVEEIIRITFDS